MCRTRLIRRRQKGRYGQERCHRRYIDAAVEQTTMMDIIGMNVVVVVVEGVHSNLEQVGEQEE